MVHLWVHVNQNFLRFLLLEASGSSIEIRRLGFIKILQMRPLHRQPLLRMGRPILEALSIDAPPVISHDFELLSGFKHRVDRLVKLIKPLLAFDRPPRRPKSFVEVIDCSRHFF